MAARSFDRDTLERAFSEIGNRAINDGRLVEIAVYGGSALVLTLDYREATRDVDSVFERDKTWLRNVAREIAHENGWDESWINDGVKGFLSRHDADPSSKRLFKAYPSEDNPGLKVMVAVPEYLFAMKCMAMRIGGVDETEDKHDILELIDVIGLKDADEALDLVASFYPNSRIPAKAQFGLVEIFEERDAGEIKL